MHYVVTENIVFLFYSVVSSPIRKGWTWQRCPFHWVQPNSDGIPKEAVWDIHGLGCCSSLFHRVHKQTSHHCLQILSIRPCNMEIIGRNLHDAVVPSLNYCSVQLTMFFSFAPYFLSYCLFSTAPKLPWAMFSMTSSSPPTLDPSLTWPLHSPSNLVLRAPHWTVSPPTSMTLNNQAPFLATPPSPLSDKGFLRAQSSAPCFSFVVTCVTAGSMTTARKGEVDRE